MIAGALLTRAALSRPGLVVITATLFFAFYEGAPTGPLSRLPFVGPIVERVSGGRVDRVRLAAIEEARRGFVLEADKRAAEAELAEVRRQLGAASAARERFATALAETRLAAAARLETLETEIADYEHRLAAAGRLCRLDRGDIDWLRRD